MSIFNLDLDGLSYYTTKIKQYIEDKILNKVDKVSGKGLSTNDLTNTLKNNYDSAYTHSTTAHAPSNAQANVIETIKVNGTALAPSSKAVNITVPSVGNGTVTIKQAGVSKGTFTMNQSGDTTIELTDNNTTYGVATQSANGLMSSTDKSKLDYTNIAFCTCDTAAATSTKVVTLSDNTNWTLKVGAIIVVKFTNTNTASSVTLNVNGTGAKSIWYNQSVYTSNWNLITGYANRPLMYMYDGTYWVWISQSGDNDTQDRTRFAQAIKCGTNAIVAGNIIVGKDGVYSHLKLGNAFDITYPILYAVSSISASSTGTNSYLVIPLTITTTQSITLTAYKPVYIKGNLSGTIFTPISTTPLTQTVPTSVDGYEYILLGVAYSTTGIYLLADHPIFAYKGGAFGQISSKGITDLSVSEKTITYTRGDGSTGTITTQDTTYGTAGSSLGLMKSGGDLTIADGVAQVNDNSHAHTIANVTGLQSALDGKAASSHTHSSVQYARELVDISGNLLDVGSVNTPVYFNGGIPEACTSVMTSANFVLDGTTLNITTN